MSPLDNRCIAFGKHIYKCKMTPPNAQQSKHMWSIPMLHLQKTYHISFAKTQFRYTFTLSHVNDKMFSHCISLSSAREKRCHRVRLGVGGMWLV